MHNYLSLCITRWDEQSKFSTLLHIADKRMDFRHDRSFEAWCRRLGNIPKFFILNYYGYFIPPAMFQFLQISLTKYSNIGYDIIGKMKRSLGSVVKKQFNIKNIYMCIHTYTFFYIHNHKRLEYYCNLYRIS